MSEAVLVEGADTALDAREIERPGEPSEHGHWVWGLLGWLSACAAACIVALTFGLNYGINNQVVYLVGALRLVHPGILDHDWYAAQTTHYHPFYTYLGAALLWLDPRGWGVAFADLVLMIAGMLFSYRAALVLGGRRYALPIFIALLCFVCQTRSQGTGGSYVFAGFFQPSSIGSLGLLAALPFWLEGRFLASGICLALGGLFHANFLILSFPVFGFAQLLLGRENLPRRLMQQLLPCCVSLVLLSPLILASVGSPEAKVAQDLYFHMRSPHHYEPASYERWFGPLLGYQVFGFGAGLWLLQRGDDCTRRFSALLVAMSALLWTGTVLTTAVYIPMVAQLFVWRFAPFADHFWQLLICTSVVLCLVAPGQMRRRFPDLALSAFLAGLGFLLMFFGDRKDQRMMLLLSWILAGFVVSWACYAATLIPRLGLSPRRLGLLRRVAPVLLLIPALAGFYYEVDPKHRRWPVQMGIAGAEAELTRWMRTKTPRDAQFLSPPSMESIRFHGQRAIVVDWKATPIVPRDLVEWRARIADVVGTPPERVTQRELGRYDGMDQTRLDRLKSKYHLDYAIVRRGRERGLTGSVVYENGGFVVLKL